MANKITGKISCEYVDIPQYTDFPYTASYDELKNETTIVFDSTYSKLYPENGVETPVTITAVVTDPETGLSQQTTGTYKLESAAPNRVYRYISLSPNTLVIQHKSTAGNKKIKISVSSEHRKYNTLYSGSNSKEITVGTYTYGKAEAPTNISLKINNETIQPSEVYNTYRDAELKIFWDAAIPGANNKIVNYKLVCMDLNNNLTYPVLLTPSITQYEFVVMDLFPQLKKGTSFQISIQSISELGEGNLDSDPVIIGKIKLINKAPEKPEFDIEGYIRANAKQGEYSTITLTNFSMIDVDEDFCIGFYRLRNKSSGQIIRDKKEFVGTTLQIPYGANQISLMIQEQEGEGLASEWSDWKEISQNQKPTCNITFDYLESESIKSKDNSRTYIKALRNLTAQFTNVKADIVSYLWKIQGNDNTFTSESVGYIELPPINSTSGGAAQVKVTLTITDKANDQFSYDLTSNYYRLKTNSPSSFSAHPQNEIESVGQGYLGDLIKFNLNIEQQSTDVEYTLYFYKIYEDNGKQIESQLSGSSKAINGSNYYENYEPEFSQGINYKFKVVVINPFGQEVGSSITVTSYSLLGVLNVGSFSFSETDWHPLKLYMDAGKDLNNDKQLSFQTTFADNDGVTGNNFYTLRAIYDSQMHILAEKISYNKDTIQQGFTTEVQGNTIYFYIKSWTLFEKLKTTTNSGKKSIQFEVDVLNAFGSKGSTKACIATLITQEAPEFKTKEAISPLKAQVNNDATSSYATWFNPGDPVDFIIQATPYDYNDWEASYNIDTSQFVYTDIKSIIGYELSYKYSENEPWTLIQKGNFINQNKYLESISVPSMPALSQNGIATKVLFGVRLEDAAGMLSNYIITELLACRKTQPVFNISSIKLDKDAEGILNIKIISTDLGGNNNGYENFTRSGEETTKIEIQLGQDEKTFQTALQPIILNNLELSGFETGLNIPITFYNEQNWTKIYAKVIVTITANSKTGDQLPVAEAMYLFYLNAPTVSHRYHWMGINTTDNNSNQVLHVSKFENQDTVVFSGHENGQEVLITFNLTTGHINGAILNGGSW